MSRLIIVAVWLLLIASMFALSIPSVTIPDPCIGCEAFLSRSLEDSTYSGRYSLADTTSFDLIGLSDMGAIHVPVSSTTLPLDFKPSKYTAVMQCCSTHNSGSGGYLAHVPVASTTLPLDVKPSKYTAVM